MDRPRSTSGQRAETSTSAEHGREFGEDGTIATLTILVLTFADMLPLVGATVGAIPAVFVAFLASPGLGIATIVFFVVYPLFENHVIQTTIMAKTSRTSSASAPGIRPGTV